jgi:hypothetical protein
VTRMDDFCFVDDNTMLVDAGSSFTCGVCDGVSYHMWVMGIRVTPPYFANAI